jgi:ribosomal-protein-alanine N-acetyltransferase
LRESGSAYNSTRLIFEPLRAEHAAALFEALRDPLVYEHLNCEPPAAVDELSEEFARLSAGPPPGRGDQQWINFAVQRKTDDRWIGRVPATVHANWAEVAYLFEPACWGHGYASESLAWLQRYIESQEGVSEFWASAAPTNQRSISLLLRADYRRASLCDVRPLGSFEAGDDVFRFVNETSINDDLANEHFR